MRRLLAAAAALALAGCGGGEPERRQTPAALGQGVELRLEVVATGFVAPVQAVPLPGSRGELAVVQQGGLVRVLPGRRVLLDLRDRVSTGGERGLLSIAFHPDYPADRRLYASFTDLAGDSRVIELASSGERELIRVDQPYENHNGGHIRFGPDRRLYLGLGDGGDAFDPEQRSQDPSTRLGKLLRLDVDRPGAEWETVALGLRNPWRFSFDEQSGDLWIGDVGQDLWEEVNVVRGAPRGLLNFGWDVYEGGERVEEHELGPGRLVNPVAVYGHDLGCSVTGGHVVATGGLAGRYVYGDFCSGRIFSLRASDGGDVRLERGRVPQLTSFGLDADGRLLLVSARGRVLRLRD